jgi:glycosyltransferase involved in cell wall biosynthesis
MDVKLTVVTVTYNAESCVEKTLRSILSQSYQNKELIVIDGSSSDSTMDIVNRYKSQIALIVSEPDKGIYDAMNKGARLATGDWIVFMNAGDEFADNDVLADVARNCDNCDVLYGDTLIEYEFGTLYSKAALFSKNDRNLPLCHQSTYVKTELMKRGFNTEYKIAADYGFFYNLYKDGYIFKYIGRPMSHYDMQGFSSSRVLQTYKEVARINGTIHSMRYYYNVCSITCSELVKKIVPAFVLKTYRKILYRR